MRLLYIAGPYSPIPGRTIQQNIDHAEAAMLRLCGMGYSVICPHKNTAGLEVFDEDLPKGFWVERDLEQVRRCDGVYMLERWEESKGAVLERAWALVLHKPVFYEGRDEPPDLRRWPYEVAR